VNECFGHIEDREEAAMTYGGDPYQRDPFAQDPFGGPAAPAQRPVAPPPGPPTPQQGSHLMASLAIAFAFLCAPVGAILGHVALGQAEDRRGRDLALVGITLSYVFIVTAVVLWVVAYAMYR
jgi:eukaryotic-like serine/threonine-protein kinase